MVLFEVTMGLLLKFGRVFYGDSGAFVLNLVVLFVVTVGLLLKLGRGVCGDSGAVAKIWSYCLW